MPLRRYRVVDLSWWRVEQAWGRARLQSLQGWDSLRPTESGRCTESWDPCYDLPLGWASIARLWNGATSPCVLHTPYSVLRTEIPFPILSTWFKFFNDIILPCFLCRRPLPSASSLKWNPCCIWVRSHGLVWVYGLAFSRRFRHCHCVSIEGHITYGKICDRSWLLFPKIDMRLCILLATLWLISPAPHVCKALQSSHYGVWFLASLCSLRLLCRKLVREWDMSWQESGAGIPGRS